MNHPLVTVIIPFYENVGLLCEAVDSVLNQTYKNIEVIVVNDGSKEDMSAFLESYSSKIIYIYQQNEGPASARNRGIAEANGEFIAFEDSDDIWMPSKIEKQVKLMLDSGAEWCHTGFCYWWSSTGTLRRVNTSDDYGDVAVKCMVSTRIATPSVVVRRAIIERDGVLFPVQYRVGEDTCFYTMLSSRYKLALVDEPLVHVRMRENNSFKSAIKRFSFYASWYKTMLNQGYKMPLMVHFIKRIYVLYEMVLGHGYSTGKEVVAKVMWTLPYMLERCYLLYLHLVSDRDKAYIAH